MRLDKLMFERGMVKSRSRAQALILAGKVYVDGKKIEKAGCDISEESFIEIRGPDHPYVSRGGIKLESAIKRFGIICKDKIALDIGASTGGFTDCLLQHGARKVYALDVGFGQLAWHLRQDPRVVNLERINVRHVEPGLIDDPLDIVTIDCSFISLRLVIKSIFPIISDRTQLICLIKPQFEVGKGEVSKGGVIRDRTKHERVLQGICDFVQEMDFHIQRLISSPIKGPKGNKEFFLYMMKGKSKKKIDLQEAIRMALDEA